MRQCNRSEWPACVAWYDVGAIVELTGGPVDEHYDGALDGRLEDNPKSVAEALANARRRKHARRKPGARRG
jgi:hypothetical protein